ncbi:ATP-dependent acyl-CoA ligase [Novosphingobium sp. KN65.2]|uniref:ATP-dependent acyl-CoA ligase n=1 Tax=Novosphingobium sp. KN65.2 TaxID=1478134 RepID=UPI0005E66F0B|nr:ATP-dependent acyl-CoA ligase [Novosphingobium sp. KN65.2]CDO37939.1 AMP-dependent synthetase and ligase [Novosphingobium sp. KN65.2]
MKDSQRIQQVSENTLRTIPAMLRRCAVDGGDKTFLSISGLQLTAAQLEDRAARMATVLEAAGVGPGDRVAILCGNRVELFDLLLGCAWLNAVAVPINKASRGPQLHHILANSGARLLAAEADVLPALDHIAREGLALETLWVLPEQGEVPAISADWDVEPLPPLTTPREPVPCQPSDTAMIIYTSGTTGPSKGVCCPHAQFYWWGHHSVEILELTADDVLLTSLPLFHVNALATVFSAMLSGASVVALERFSASGFSKSLVEHKATVTYLLGAMVSILLATPGHPEDNRHRVRRALAPGVPRHFHQDFTDRFGIGLVDGYGSTETCFVIGDKVAEGKPGSMGRVRDGFQAKVVDEWDNEVADGTPGELLIRPEQPFSTSSGYFHLHEQTVAAWRNLWFHTGDRVYRDEAGYFYFMDRIKDAIRRRGENISAYEVEQVLLSHPAVAIAAVYSVDSEHGEDEVMASVVLTEGADLSHEQLLDFCQPRMAYYAVPRFVRFVNELPRTENGKVQKYKLREEGITVDAWDREAAGYKLIRDARRHKA